MNLETDLIFHRYDSAFGIRSNSFSFKKALLNGQSKGVSF